MDSQRLNLILSGDFNLNTLKSYQTVQKENNFWAQLKLNDAYMPLNLSLQGAFEDIGILR